jgi:succinate-acetate transporter protein
VSEAAPETRVVLRPIASPLPLGFLGLAGATLVVAGLQLGWVPASERTLVALALIAFTVPLQGLASIFGFLGRDVVTATGMGLLAGIWLAIALVLLASTGPTSRTLGLFLLAGGAAMLVPAGAATASKLVPALVLGTAGLRFLLTALHQLTGSEAWEDAAGVVGLVLCALAVYAGLAAALEDALERDVLPFGRRGASARALGAEPGLRHPL